MSDEPRASSGGQRAVRSYVRREGRITPGQQRAMDSLWPRYGVPLEAGEARLDPAELFGNDRPVVLEIGFGNGDSLAAMARAHPDWNYLGIEVHRPGVGRLLQTLESLEIANVRVLDRDAVEVLGNALPACSIDRVQLFFPDPWPKKKHHKRRIVQPAFLDLLHDVLKPGGIFHAATDWEDYALHMLVVLGADARFENLAGRGAFSPRPPDRPLTKFEDRGKRLGHGVWDLLYRRLPG
jgi:tRNA (guanine-N7-)-methyltransferase